MGDLKGKKNYQKIPNKKFFLFLRETEQRRNNIGYNKSKKLQDLFSIFEYVKVTSLSLYTIDDLLKI